MSRMRSCPCCGAPVEAETALDLACRAVTPTMAAILRVIAKRPGIRRDGIAAAIYRHRADGGPMNALQVISAMICANRARLVGTGVRVAYADATAQSGFMVVFDAPVTA